MDLTTDLVESEPGAKPIPVPEPSPSEHALKNRIDDLCAMAERAVIDNQESFEKGADLGKLLRAAKAKGEEERTKITGPLNEVLRIINDRFRGPTAKLEAARRVIDKKMLEYTEKVEKQRRAEAEEARRKEEAARLQAAEENPTAPATEFVPRKAVSAAPVARGNLGSVASVRSRWTWRLVDISKVPAEHLLPNASTLQKAVNAGAREISGVEIYEEKGITVR